MANPLQLPFEFPPNATPTTHQLQANFNALLAFVQNLNDGVTALTNLLVSTLTTTSTATIGGALMASAAATVTGALVANSTATIAGALTASGAATVTGALVANSTAALNGATSVGGVLTASSTVTSTGLVTANNGVTVNNAALTANSTSTLNGATTVGSTLGVTGDLTSSATVKLADGSVSAPALRFSNSTAAGLYRASANNLAFSTASTQGWQIDADGHILQPIQPCFESREIAVPQSKTGNLDPATFASEQFDIGGNFDTSTSIFTAPVTGKYFLSYALSLKPRAGTPATNFKITLVTSNRNYSIYQELDSTTTEKTYTFSVVVDMDLSDTAYVKVEPGAAQTWTYCNSTASIFSGTLIN
jgi:hypothetical protein